MASSGATPEAMYAARAEAFGGEAQAWTVRFNRVANLRLVAFVAGAGLLVWGVVQAAVPLLIAGVAVEAVFLWLVRYHQVLGERRDRAAALRGINEVAIHRLRRDWSAVPLRHSVRADAAHGYAADLDLFGHASLLHLLDTAGTSMGRSTLVRWLLEAASPTTVRERQESVRELAPRLDLRQELQASGGSTLDPEPFLAWAESEPQLRHQGLLVWGARLSPVGLIGLAVAQIVGVLEAPWWLAFLFSNAALWQLGGKRAYPVLSRVDDMQTALQQYAACFRVLSSHEAQAGLEAIERITRFVIPRTAQVYWVVQPLLLWDVHVMAALESWQARNGGRVRGWLDALGEVEALAAFAALAHAHPAWSMPRIDATVQRLEAEQAGHPLLPPEVRVDNDVELGPGGTFVLVTGSNMAGKSTYLRTIGTNIVLAQAGGPVCASTWRMPPLELCTSMRVVDSLERGVSTFLAEVLRLKQVVDTARSVEDGRAVCFLLDEILQGTNTAERQIAARRVIRFLLGCGAMGAVSTHDLSLVDEAGLHEAARLVHFSDTLTAGPNGPVMTFDHRLQPGLAMSTNALRLVAMLGLGDD